MILLGTRPTLLTEITLTSGLVTIDFSDQMKDFTAEDVQIIIGNYFDLSGYY